jgi:aminoglycoside 6'-N-acetyltransferase I
VEGWFVQEEFRNRGVGRELMRSAEDCPRDQGCLEMASDALMDNEGSQRAHEALGFDVVTDVCTFARGYNDAQTDRRINFSSIRPCQKVRFFYAP